jgi:hypothetical protein
LHDQEGPIQARFDQTLVSNSTFDRGSLSPTYVKPFDVFAKGVKLEIGSSGWTRTSNPPRALAAQLTLEE